MTGGGAAEPDPALPEAAAGAAATGAAAAPAAGAPAAAPGTAATPPATISPRDLRDAAFRALSASGMPAGSATRAAEMAEWLEVHDEEGLLAIETALRARAAATDPDRGLAQPDRGLLCLEGAPALAVGATIVDLACCAGWLLVTGLIDPWRLDEPAVAAASRNVEPIAVVSRSWARAMVPEGSGVAEHRIAVDPGLAEGEVRLLIGEAAARLPAQSTVRTAAERSARRHEVRRRGLTVPAARWAWLRQRSRAYLVADD